MRRDDATPARGRTVVVWGSLAFGCLMVAAAFMAGTLLASQADATDTGTQSIELARLDSEPEAEREAQPSPHVEPGTAEANTALRIDEPSRGDASRDSADSAAANAAEVLRVEEAGDDRPMFDGRPIEKVRTMQMHVTAYSPDERSCGPYADGITASGYSVWTNGMRLVAADTSVLPFKTLVSVPGYNGGKPVQVLDRGGAIKGNRLDVLYSTHERALVWGVQDLEVTIWRYADE